MTLSLPKLRLKSPAPVMAWASGAMVDDRRMADATEAVATNLEKGLFFFISREEVVFWDGTETGAGANAEALEIAKKATRAEVLTILMLLSCLFKEY